MNKNDKLLFDRVKEEINIWSTCGFEDPVGFLYKLVQKYNGPFDSICYDTLKYHAEFLHVSLVDHPSMINNLTHEVIARYDLSLHKKTLLRRFWNFIICQ